jgi:hypothetical protein
MALLSRREFLAWWAPAAVALTLASAKPTLGQELAPDSLAHAEAAWQRDWRELVAAAQQEGQLGLLTWVGRGYRRTVEEFERRFPGIRIAHVEESSAEAWLGRVQRERRAGTYAFDLGFLHTDRALQAGAPEGMCGRRSSRCCFIRRSSTTRHGATD